MAYSDLQEFVKRNDEVSLGKFGLGADLHNDILLARSYLLTPYGEKTIEYISLDKLRYILASSSDKPASQFPPTEDDFAQHVLRCRLMVSVWCRIQIPCPKLANPVGNGWKVGNNNAIDSVIYKNDAAPIEVCALTHLYSSDKDCTVTKK